MRGIDVSGEIDKEFVWRVQEAFSFHALESYEHAQAVAAILQANDDLMEHLDAIVQIAQHVRDDAMLEEAMNHWGDDL